MRATVADILVVRSIHALTIVPFGSLARCAVQCPAPYRRLVWKDLAQLRSSLDVPPPVPIDEFMWPVETNKPLLQLYFAAICCA